ncbi:hypothetical protein ACX6XY_12275 [Streptomyces sp. O3]
MSPASRTSSAANPNKREPPVGPADFLRDVAAGVYEPVPVTSSGVSRAADRNTVERAINKLKQAQAVATRYDKRRYVYLGTATVAALTIWLRT